MQNSKLKTQNCNSKLKAIYIIILAATLGLLSCVSAAWATPIIDRIEVTSVSNSTMIVTFRTTNETTTAEVRCGIAEVPSTANWSTNEASNYHYAQITNLYPNAEYQFKIYCTSTLGAVTSSETMTFTTLSQPSGDYLFSYAIISDLQYAEGMSDATGPRGRPYSQCATTLNSAVSEVNVHNPAFTVLLGDMVEAAYITTPVGDQVQSKMKAKLDNLTKAADITYRYFPITGNHDKIAAYSTGNWVTKNTGLLYPPINTVSETTSCDANYSFNYHDYHFIMLDSVKWDGTKAGSVDASWLSADLAANIDKKTFVFMHYPGLDVSTEGMVLSVPQETISGLTVPWQIDNITTFQNIIDTYKSQIAGVYMGHIHDAMKVMKHGNTVPYVRVPSLVQFPVGYTIVKVYTNGFTQTFYKVKANNISETARNQITEGTSSVEAGIWEQVWLGSNSARNFTQTYNYINGSLPTVQNTAPASGETSVPINQPLHIQFSKVMTTDVASNWINIFPSITTSLTLDATHTKLIVNHTSNFAENTPYTVTLTTNCKDADNNAMAANHVFTFTTTTAAFTPTLYATFEAIRYNLTSDQTPTFTGIATADPTGIANIEYKIDDGEWASAEALDGRFNTTTEAFVVRITAQLDRGRHLLYSRVIDFAGNIYTDPYAFYVVSNRPWIEATINGQEIDPGDPIISTPSIEATIVAANGLNTSSLLLNFDDSTIITSSGLTIVPIDPPASYNVYYTLTSALTDGSHNIKLFAVDLSGNPNTWEAPSVIVQGSGTAVLQGMPLNYPNPFAPGSTTQIGYTLSRDANIQLTIYNLMGTQIVRKNYTAGTNGGKIGYNMVTWDGLTDSGVTCGFGLYIYVLVADGQLLGRGKIAIAQQ